jgi:uncharacterized delta-60 repeat protein
MKILITTFLFFCTINLYAQSGIGLLDSTFAVNGILTDSFTRTHTNYFEKVLPGGSGRLLAIGDTAWGAVYASTFIRRYKPDGSIDASFGSAGISYINVDTVTFTADAALQSDGKIVMVGHAGVIANKLLVLRAKPDGSLDSTFGTNGHVFITPSPGFRDLYGIKVKIQNDNNILVGIQGYDTAYFTDFVVIRLTPTGAIDATYGKNGFFVRKFIDTAANNLWNMELLQNGKLVLIGDYFANPAWTVALTRLNTNGSTDSTFGVNGAVKGGFGSNYNFGYSIVEQSDKKLIAGIVADDTAIHHFTYHDYVLMRLNEDGSPDNSWGQNGLVFTGIQPYDHPLFLDVATTGKLLLAAQVIDTGAGGGYDYLAARFKSDGSFDSSFGMNGQSIVQVKASPSYLQDMASCIFVDVYNKAMFLGGTESPGKVNLLKFKLENNIAVSAVSSQHDRTLFFPNPVTTRGLLQFSLSNDAFTNISMYDIEGRLVDILEPGKLMSKGVYELPVDVSKLAPGNYIVIIHTGKEVSSIKLNKY